MNRRLPLLFLCALWLIAAAVAAPAVTRPGSGPGGGPGGEHVPRLQAVTAAGDSSAPALRVAVSVPYRWLVFRRDGDGYAARARLIVEAVRDGRPVGGDVVEATARVDRAAAAWTSRPLDLTARVTLPDTAAVTLRLTVEGVGTRRRWRREVAVRPARLLRQALVPLAAAWRTVPPGAVLAAAGDSVVLRLVLVAAGHAPRRTLLELAAVAAADGETLVVDRATLRPAPGETVAVVLGAAAADLPFGEHELLPRADGRPLAGVARLDLFDLAIPWDDDRAWARHVSWLEGIVDKAARDSLRRLPPAARPTAWRRVWASRPPDAHPTEREHLLRIVEADRRFGGFGRGAASDRGRVFIRLGEPDRIEDYADERSYPARWEIWYYERLGVAYRFYDAFGMGDYRLYDTVPI